MVKIQLSRRLFNLSAILLFIFVAIYAAISLVPKADELAQASNEITLIGTYRVITIDDFENRTMRHEFHLEVNDQDYILQFPKEHNHTEIPPSSQVKVVGTIDGSVISVKSIEPYKKEVAGIQVVKDEVPTTGKRKLAIIVNLFSNSENNQSRQDETIQIIKDSAALKEKSVVDYYKAVSYGKLELSVDVLGMFTVPFASSSECDYDNWSQAAQVKAKEANVNLNQYDFISYVFPDATSCVEGGRGELRGTESWIFQYSPPEDFKFVLAHEFGHNLGLHHANSLDCSKSATVRGGPSISEPLAIGELCTSGEYGDPFDVMGYNNKLNQFNSYEKDLLNWFEPNNVKTVTTSGTYTLKPLETASNDVQAIKIYRYGIPTEELRSTNSNFYIDYRATDGFSTSSDSKKLAGVSVRLAPTKDTYLYARKSQIIRVNPENLISGDFDFDLTSRYILVPGKSFFDPQSGVTITTISVTPNEATVKVDIPSSNKAPSLSFSSQLTGKIKVKQKYTVKASILDSDSDSEVTFYHNDNSTDTGGYPIESKSCERIKVKQASKPKTLSCTFPIEPWYANANNEIYIYALAKDFKTPPITVYAKGKLQLIPNQSPTITLSNPATAGETLTQGSIYTVRYSLNDPDDKVTARFSLYKVSEQSEEASTYPIKECAKKAESTNGTCQFSTSSLENGEYVLYAFAEDPAYNSAYNEAPGTLTIKPGETVNKPSELTAQKKTNGNVVKWRDNSSNESGFEIWRLVLGDPDNYVYKSVGKVKANTIEWRDTSAKKDSDYFYKVRAYATKGKVTTYSDFSLSVHLE